MVAYHAKEDGRWDDTAWVKTTSREEMISKFDGYFEPVMQVLEMVENPIMWALFDHLPAHTFHRKGHICLLGDSAHASTPHHGAGAGMAVEDALILSRLLASIDDAEELELAFAAYDTVRRPRSQRLVASSRKVAEVYDFENKEIGDDMEAMQAYLDSAWNWIWYEDLTAHLKEAENALTDMRRAKIREMNGVS